jgi:uncharacterized protein (TIGR02145 family)
LPAAGARNFTNGALVTRGNLGSYWSSTENGGNALYLSFSSSYYVNSANDFNRLNGISVRCIAE